MWDVKNPYQIMCSLSPDKILIFALYGVTHQFSGSHVTLVVLHALIPEEMLSMVSMFAVSYLYAEILTTWMIVLGDERFEERPQMKGITKESGLTLPPYMETARNNLSVCQKQGFIRCWIWRYLSWTSQILQLRNKFTLFVVFCYSNPGRLKQEERKPHKWC